MTEIPLLLIKPSEIHLQRTLESAIQHVLSPLPNNSKIYVLITDDYDTLDILIDDLVRVYDTIRKLTTEGEQYPAYVLFGDNYEKLFSTCHWTDVYYMNETSLAHFQNKKRLTTHKLTIDSGAQNIETDGNICHLHYLSDQYDTVAVGGTFDHLHDGHKILLTASTFLARNILIVGVTGPKLLTNKKYSEYLDSYDKRVDEVRSFIRLIQYNQRVDIYQINDVCGPTAVIPDIDALVVSLETAAGGEYVNKVRKQRNFKELDVIKVIVVGDTYGKVDIKDKLSSTTLRMKEAKAHSAHNM